MPQEQLKQTLQSLHKELSASQALDPELRAELAQLAAEIDRVLQRSGASAPTDEDDESLLDRVNGLGSRFEESHPKLAQIIGRVADGLSQLGI